MLRAIFRVRRTPPQLPGSSIRELPGFLRRMPAPRFPNADTDDDLVPQGLAAFVTLISTDAKRIRSTSITHTVYVDNYGAEIETRRAGE